MILHQRFVFLSKQKLGVASFQEFSQREVAVVYIKLITTNCLFYEEKNSIIESSVKFSNNATKSRIKPPTTNL